MPFGTAGRTGPGMRQVVGFGDRSTGRGNFGGKYGGTRCNQWGLLVLRRLLLGEFLQLQARLAGEPGGRAVQA